MGTGTAGRLAPVPLVQRLRDRASSESWNVRGPARQRVRIQCSFQLQLTPTGGGGGVGPNAWQAFGPR